MSGISKYSSIVYRMSQTFFDDYLAPYQIGCGQQFFLREIYQTPGISQYELAEIGHFDKGTTARAVKKLEDLGYITRVTDEKDRRFTRLYVSDAGASVISVVQNMMEEWYAVLGNGLSEEEEHIADELMKRIAHNASCHVLHKQKEGK